MRKNQRFIISLFLIVSLLSALAVSSFADGEEQTESESPDTETTETVETADETPVTDDISAQSTETVTVTAGQQYNNDSSTVFNNGGVVFNSNGIVYNNGGIVYNNGGTVYNNGGIVFNNLGVAYNNGGVAYANGGKLVNNSGTVYNNGGEVVETACAVDDETKAEAEETEETPSEEAEHPEEAEPAETEETVEASNGESAAEADQTVDVAADADTGEEVSDTAEAMEEPESTESDASAETALVSGDATEPVAPEAPVISLASGTYCEAKNVELTSESGYDIYYTTDGTEPNEESSVYTGPIEISDNTVLQAAVIAPDGLESKIAEEIYVFPEITAPVFKTQKVGYTRPSGQSFIVANNGAGKAEIKSVTLSKESQSYFTFSNRTGVTKITSGMKDSKSWVLHPKAGLAAGEYTAEVVFTFGSGDTKTIEVTFTVES